MKKATEKATSNSEQISLEGNAICGVVFQEGNAICGVSFQEGKSDWIQSACGTKESTFSASCLSCGKYIKPNIRNILSAFATLS